MNEYNYSTTNGYTCTAHVIYILNINVSKTAVLLHLL